jgi:hypothetical protein
LFRDGWAPNLLISVSRFEIRRFSSLELPVSLDLPAIASAIEPQSRHYFVQIGSGSAEAWRVAVSRFGTLREIRAFSDWLRDNPSIRSAMVVSSGFHLKRVRMCCRRLVPDGPRLHFVAAPDGSRSLRGSWWRDRAARKLVLSELVKIAVYKLLRQGRITRTRSALRGVAGTCGVEVQESR